MPLRFWAKVMPEPNSGCWLWTGHVYPNGYGEYRHLGKNGYAHRASVMALGGGIPDGLHVDHLCRTRSCCNPAHLEPVTRHENVRRGLGPTRARETIKIAQSSPALAAHRARASTITHCPQGHPYDAENSGYRICRGRRSRYCRTCVNACSRRWQEKHR